LKSGSLAIAAQSAAVGALVMNCWAVAIEKSATAISSAAAGISKRILFFSFMV
jgi:hypothetical protein